MYVITCLQKVTSPRLNTRGTPMFSKEDTDFIDMLFGKLVKHVDTDMIDLHDDDSCCDHLEFEQLALF
jgi:hypothetical protein